MALTRPGRWEREETGTLAEALHCNYTVIQEAEGPLLTGAEEAGILDSTENVHSALKA